MPAGYGICNKKSTGEGREDPPLLSAHCRGGNLPPGHFVYKMASPTAIIIYFLRKSQQLLRNYWAGGKCKPLRLLSKISGFLTDCKGGS